MGKIIDVGVEKDHIEALTRANGITAISELIWNSLDADASEINIEYKKNAISGYEYIKIKDNGHGLPYSKVQNVFGKLGGSEKKSTTQSPKGRAFHGKEGKGRYKSLALGDLVEFKSICRNDGHYEQFNVKLDVNNITHTEVSDIVSLINVDNLSGFAVEIYNINQKSAEQALQIESRKEYEEKFASYWISYPTFNITFNGYELHFNSLIRHTEQKPVTHQVGTLTYSFEIKIIEWNFDNTKKTYLCNAKGIPYLETSLGLRSSLPISIFIQSVYIEELHRKSTLQLEEFDETLNIVLKEARGFAREYVRRRLSFYSKSFIDELKDKDIYPYKGESENIVEETKRQVFDIVALQIHDYLPSFDEQDDKGKKLLLSLLKEALESDSSNLNKILTEIIELPEEKREELVEILESTSLSNIIDTMAVIKNRLHFINGLEQIIYDKNINKTISERKQLHKILVKETWIFGDHYALGVDDLSLKNVLKSYLKDCLGRTDFEEILESSDNNELNKIPDVCLWQQYSMGTAGRENLVIELKKPNLDAGLTELTQIMSYASRVSNDPRFPKDQTKWKFILITKDIKPELEPQLRQKNRKYGHVTEGDNFDVFVLTWGQILSEAKNRHEFIKKKLNLNLQDNEHGLDYLRSKYKEYLPEDILTETETTNS